MELYNYLTRTVEKFEPRHPPKVSLYTCGPTVYDYAHIGNLRTYIFEDLLRRTLEYNGYDVRHIMNITDIEDKIVKRALGEGVNFNEITQRFTATFREDLKKLNLLAAHKYPTVTGHIHEIVELIGVLLEKSYAYVADDGSVYFDISRFDRYGELARLDQQSLKEGASGRVFSDEYSKDQVNDFVLWKAQTEENEPSWDSPWGKGRPGWHIECSVLAMEYLGEQIDIHAGAVDLIFPHHTNEIAQSEAATGKKFVNYWIEGEHLLVDGQKMSKSLGNYYTLRDIEKRGHDPLAFRYLMLQTHYRKKLNFTWESLEAAEKGLENLKPKILSLKSATTQSVSSYATNEPSVTYLEQFRKAIESDLNFPQALAAIWELVDNAAIDATTKLATILDFDRVLGLKLDQTDIPDIPDEIQALLEKREEFRQNKKFDQADALRKEIEKKGYTIEDTTKGPRITWRTSKR